MTSDPHSSSKVPEDSADYSPQASRPSPDTTPPPRNAIVVVVDRFSAGYLGCYGNTWLETPEWNRLAGNSLLFEFATTDSPRLEEVYSSYWTGGRSVAECDSEKLGPSDSVPGIIRRAGVFACLVTDDPLVAELAPPDAFDQHVIVGTEPIATTADSVAQTQMAKVFAAALDARESLHPPFLLWIHLRGMEGLWDAPYELRQRLTEDEDPDAPDFVDPPRLVLDPLKDYDVRWGIMRAYAGQVLALDTCIGVFADELREMAGHGETLMVWTSPRGYPLGEHGEVGAELAAMHGETLHVPWFLSFPDRAEIGARCMNLIHPPDLAMTLLDWWGAEGLAPPMVERRGSSLLALAENPDSDGRPYVVASADNRVAMRSRHWLATRDSELSWRLYVKPDDRFEANEVSRRCREVVEALDGWLITYQVAESEGLTSFPLLPDSLSRSVSEL